MAVNKTKLTGGGEIGEVNKKKSLPVRILEWVKSHKKPLLISLVLGVGLTGGIFVGKAIWDANFSLSPEKEAELYQEAENLVILSKVDEANQKYQDIVSKKIQSSDKAVVYAKQSAICFRHRQYDCSLAAWQEYGKLTTKDYLYFKTEASLYIAKGDQEGYKQAAQNALNDLKSKPSLTDEEQQIKSEIESFLNG